MRQFPFVLGLFAIPLLIGCGASNETATTATTGSTVSSTSSTGAGGGGGAGGASSSSTGSGGSGGQSSGPPSAMELLALLGNCQEITNGQYKTDSNTAATVPVCQLQGAVYWQADMDVDCDGITTAQCNSTTDPWYQAQTAATDSMGNYLDAANLPYVVVPGVSSRFSYSAAGLSMGSIVAVIYNGKLTYGVLGDVGPTAIIGEASYAMAASLGIDPDPSVGGADSGVSYIAFTGASGKASPIEDHAATTTQGESLAQQLLDAN